MQTFKASESASIDDLVASVCRQIRPDLVRITVCGDTVRVECHDIPGAYIMGTAPAMPEWWRVYADGDYLCGMETVLDAFRAIHLARAVRKQTIEGIRNADV